MKRVLVIEDDAGIRANIVELLETEGFTVASAADGEAGVAAATSGAPDLVICDVGMPGMDGYGVLAKLRETSHTAGIPFIFLSARADRSDVRQGMKLGADDYLTKPFAHAELLDVVKARLARQEATARQLEARGPRSIANPSPARPQELRVIEEEPATTPRYLVEELLGEGGMGAVYRAFDRKLQRKVALKVLHRELLETGQGEERLLREARAAAKLEHPNAVAIYDVGESVDGPFLAMELVLGKTLRAYVGVDAISNARRVRWLLEAARALSAAHQRGLVHRDVKPENIMVRDDGVVKVLDFGIARGSAASATGASLAGTPANGARVEGTPFYMAPELLQGNRSDHRGDQFAWGVVAFELLAGRLPWLTKGSAMAQIVAMMTETAPTLASLGIYVPPGVASTIARALAKSPDDRFASMDDVIQAVEPFAETTQVAISLHATLPAHMAPSSPAADPRAARSSAPTPEPRVAPIVPAPRAAASSLPSTARSGEAPRPPPTAAAPSRGLLLTAAVASILAVVVLAVMIYALTRK